MFTIAFIPVLIQSSSQLNLELCNIQASSFFSDLQPKNIKQEGTSFAKNEKSSPPVSGLSISIKLSSPMLFTTDFFTYLVSLGSFIVTGYPWLNLYS